MSGVTGNEKIQSRANFREILKTAKQVISGFPGFISIQPTGSYNSDKKKTTFGDMDLITHIDGSLYNNDKKKIKSELAKYFKAMPDSIIAPFQSEKYMGRKYYNSGEIITVSLNVPNPSILACQVDFMIAMDAAETKFKKDFLDMPAAKQGIVLGAAKVALLEFNKNKILRDLNIKEPILEKNQEIEFNISSKEIQLRKITYNIDLLKKKEYKTIKQEIIWTSRSWENVEKILYKLDLSLSFEKLVKQIKKTFKLTRSLRRLQGVFKSMVSIKSGEVGKKKGIDKQKALDTVSKMMLESYSFKDYIDEMTYVSKNKEGFIKNNNEKAKTVGIFSGRFQPVTLAHAKIIEMMSKENDSGIVFIVKGKMTSEDKKRNPFNVEIQKKMLELVAPKNIEIKIIPTGFFVDELNKLKNTKFVAYAGSDRIKAYTSFQKYMENGNTLEIKEIKRTDEDISATKVRTTLKNNDEEEFKKLTSPKIHKMFKELKKFIN